MIFMELGDRERTVLRIIGDACDRKGQDSIKLEEVSERFRIAGFNINDVMDVLYRLEDLGLIRLEIIGYSTIIRITDKGKDVYRSL
ncbi:MAG: MarR family transcriptional regulator [Vulcanisaeta sp.]|jgi:predicted transcriptional regulator|nr:MarR family transcriptional regulator [Vulcanisaeta moutnovskia]